MRIIARYLLIYFAWIGLSCGGLYVANSLLGDKHPSLAWLLALPIWLACAPGVIAAIVTLGVPVLIAVLIAPGSNVAAIIGIIIGVPLSIPVVLGLAGWLLGGSDGSSVASVGGARESSGQRSKVRRTCPSCDGSRRCPSCDGTGFVGPLEAIAERLARRSAKCPQCHGRRTCATCYGKGYLRV